MHIDDQNDTPNLAEQEHKTPAATAPKAPTPEVPAVPEVDESETDNPVSAALAEEAQEPETPKADTPADKPEAPEAKPEKPEPDADTEAEITSLKLKDKAAERFRGLTAEVKALAPIKAQLEAAGIKDMVELPKVFERAKTADDLIGMVQDTGATAEQYGLALDYLKLVNAGANGDLKAAETAYGVMQQELAALAKLLGKEVPGVHDPLAAHSDLQEQVESGDLTRKAAVEVASLRTRQAQSDQRTQQHSEQRAAEQAQAQGTKAIDAFDQQMLTSDPSYQGKRQQLSTMVGWIKQHLPPDKWAAATQQAYATIPAAPAPKPKVGPVPLRPTGGRQALEKAVYDDPMEAMQAALVASSN